MPSLIATPATLTITGAEAATIPARFSPSPARLYVVGGVAVIGPGTGSSTSVTIPDLDYLTRGEPLVNADGTPTMRFFAIWQELTDKLIDAFTAIDARDTNQDSILARLEAAYNLASAANDNAASIGSAVALANSYPNPANVLTASNTGTITIGAHERVYGDAAETAVDVDAGSVSGLTPGQSYSVYYFDAARAGGAVSYQASTSNIAQTGDTHVIGRIAVPAAGEVDTSGTAVGAPGAIDAETAAAYEKFNPPL